MKYAAIIIITCLVLLGLQNYKAQGECKHLNEGNTHLTGQCVKLGD